MASMVAKACSGVSTQMSPVMTIPEKGSRNKRKFRADPPLADPSKIIPPAQNDCANYEFSADKFGIIPSHGSSSRCDMCCLKQESSETLKLDLGLSCAVGSSEIGLSSTKDEIGADEFHDADWSDLTESELEELVLGNLDTIFRSAIKKIIACGYTEDVATKAVLRSGICYGCKDMVSNIVDNSLAFLRNGLEIDPSREHYFEDLPQMEKYILAELVCVLREVRPFFSTGDAMWCLLICDMNVSHACAMDGDPLSSLAGDRTLNEISSICDQAQMRSEAKVSESTDSSDPKQNTTLSCAYSPSEAAKATSITAEHSFHSMAQYAGGVASFKPKSSIVANRRDLEKESSNNTLENNLFDTVEKPFSVTGTSHPSNGEEKFVSTKKVAGITRRDILRQKSLHLEKHYRTYGSKGTSRAGKLNSFSGLVLDKKLKSIADSTGTNLKTASSKIHKTVAVDGAQDSNNSNHSTNSSFPPVSAFGSETVNSVTPLTKSSVQGSLPKVDTSPTLPPADTELSLSLTAKDNSVPVPVSYNSDSFSYNYAPIPNDKSIEQWVPQNKDETILKLVPRVRELQNQLQEWTEWANQKVMQAARRLSKDKAELKTLQQEKEEVERLKKEKQTLEENTMKKLSEMENALSKASGQVEKANAAVRRLEVENTALRREMEAAKMRAVQSAASCQEVSRREKNTQVRFQSWEKQKDVFQEELVLEKRKFTQLQQELGQAKDLQAQLEARWKLEEKAKNDILTQRNSLRKEREDVEASTKSKEDMIKSKAQSTLEKYKVDIEKLEKEISQLRLKTDSSKIAALRRGIDGSYATKLTDSKSHLASKEAVTPLISKDPAGFQDNSGSGGLKRERECVMCLCEEMSVVFLPCAHQVVCTSCNEIHEKQGMTDCPSCRSVIQQRICVRYASP